MFVFFVQLRQSLDGLLNQLKNFQARLRQYASYEYVQRMLKGYLKVRKLVFSTQNKLCLTRKINCILNDLPVSFFSRLTCW